MSSDTQQSIGMRAHSKSLLAASLVSLSSFQYGLDFGIIGGLQAMVPFLQVFGYEDPTNPLGYNISSERQQLLSSLIILGSFISSSSAGFSAAYIGRKASLWVACVSVFVATALMQAATDIGVLYAGRMILGLANGLLMTHGQLYIQETLPGRYRGLGISLFTYWITVGSLIGTIVDNFASKIPSRNAYIIPLGMFHIVPGILAIGLFFIPESPRWLATNDQIQKAERSLQWLRPKEWSVAEELEDMKSALAAEQLLQTKIGYMELFRNPIDRRRTTISVFAMTTQSASGAMFVIVYGTYFLEVANVGNAFENTCLLSGIGVAALLANSFIITRFGCRRVFLILGLVLCGITQLIIAAVYTVDLGTQKSGRILVAMSVFYIIGYNGMILPYSWVSSGELPSQRLRSHTFGLAAAIGFVGAWLTTFTTPYFINPDSLNWGPKYGYIWAPSCVVAAIWVYFYLPEVKGRTLEEIDEMFEAGVPARKFSSYQCTGQHVVLEEEEKVVEEHCESV